jgi:hypothetical protein
MIELARLPTVWVPNPVPPMPASSAAIVAATTPMAAMISTMKCASTMMTPSTMMTAAAIMTAAAMTFREGRRRDEQASGECRDEGKFT